MFRRDATDLGPAGNMPPYSLAFLDPPYGKGLAAKALAVLAQGGWLTPGALCVVEDRAGEILDRPDSYLPLDQRTWGETQVHFLRFQKSA